MKQKIQALLKELNHGLVEREQTLRTALLTVLAGENLVLIGPPGTGKSLIARRIAEGLTLSEDKNADYFEYLLTKFSTPEEIFGPLSISELKADRFKRNTAGYLPSVKIAFLDEIFKASSSILNALLTILNERLYHNGAEAQKVPLQALIAASNELPTDQEELNALYDRFLVRSFVDYVREDNLSRLFDNTQDQPIQTKITADDTTHIKNTVSAVTIPPEIAEAIQRIWIKHKDTFKEDRRESLSDRRLKKVLHLLRVSAVTNGRSELDLSDVLLLKDCLWNHQENALKVSNLIVETVQRYNRLVPKNQNSILSSFKQAFKGTKKKIGQQNKEDCNDHLKESIFIMNKKTGQLDAKENGYKGLGTEEDPILIENAQDLMGLDGIGQKGYYFRQTADIDCNEISTWHTIHLQGHYDGRGHFIQYKKVGDNYYALFQSIQALSSVKNLNLSDLRLAKNVAGSHIEACKSNLHLIYENVTDSVITACQSNSHLIRGNTGNSKITACQSGYALIAGNVDNSEITACQSGGSLINGNANGSNIKACQSDEFLIVGNTGESIITACQSGSFLIRGTATDSRITDCLAVINVFGSDSQRRHHSFGGIVQTLESSTVERCLVTRPVTIPNTVGYHFFSGIADTCDASTIRQCAIGRVKMEFASWRGRITNGIKNNSTLENNISIDSNSAEQNDKQKDGKSISAAVFNQRTFEHTLGWDFKSVWQWDTQKDHPVLRSVGAGAKTVSPTKPTATQADTIDLLTQQINANIWL